MTATTLRSVGAKVEPLEVPAAECVRRLNRDARRDALAGSWSRVVEWRWRDYTRRDSDEVVQGVGGANPYIPRSSGPDANGFCVAAKLRTFFTGLQRQLGYQKPSMYICFT